MLPITTNYWSKGPHYQYNGAIIFITWRLAFTLPQHIMRMFKEIKMNPDDKCAQWTKNQLEEYETRLFKLFIEYDTALASIGYSDVSLDKTEFAKIITDAFHHFDSGKYELHAYCIMPNHIHLLICPLPDAEGDCYPVSEIVQSLKRFTSKKINQLRCENEQVWDNYYYDRIIRDSKHYTNVVQYILDNPVKAGLVKNSEDWEYSYYNTSFGIIW